VSLGKKILICPILPPMSDLTPFYGTGRPLTKVQQVLLTRSIAILPTFFEQIQVDH
jgi:hypothetical protein